MRCGVASAEEQNEADAHLEKFAAQLTEAKSFATRIDFRTSVGLPGLSHDRAMSFDLAVERPRSFALVPRGKGSGPMVMGSAERVTHFLKDLNQYTDQEAPESLDGYSQSLEAMMLLPHGMGHLVMSLLAEHPDERLIADSSERKYLGQEQIDGTISASSRRAATTTCGLRQGPSRNFAGFAPTSPRVLATKNARRVLW
jgi:hypothetical protein